MENFGNIPEIKLCQIGVKCKRKGLRWDGRRRSPCHERNQPSGRRLCRSHSEMACWLQNKRRLRNISRNEHEVVQPCSFPLPSMIVVSRWYDVKFSPMFINSWRRAAPEFPMIPPGPLGDIATFIKICQKPFHRINGSELLTLFLVLCSLDTALIFPTCVREHFLEGEEGLCLK